MKTKIYLLLLAGIMLASCSTENISENTITDANQLTLNKVETYFPSKETYEDSTAIQWVRKNVQHFENGLIVADSTYNYMHELESTTVRAYSATAASIITYDFNNNTAMSTTLFTYDNLGRIIELSVNSSDINYRKTMAYAADNSCTVTNHYDESGESEVWGTYIANVEGLLYTRNSPNENEILIFEGGKPVIYKQEMLDSNTLINMEYYDVPVPANRLKTVTQINNITLTGNLLESVSGNSDHYLKSLEGWCYYESTFNDFNYITRTLIMTMPNQSTQEIFYYYNE